MKPEISEQLLIEELFVDSMNNLNDTFTSIKEIIKLTGDASTRKYYRLHTETKSYVVCLDNPNIENKKNTFVETQGYLREKGIRVPSIFDKNLLKGYLLEEDLGDVTLLKKMSQINNTSEELEYYKSAVDSILRLHNIQDLEEIKIHFPEKFDFTKLYSEVEFSIKFFVEKFLKCNDKFSHQKILNEYQKICTRLAEEPMVLTHRDYHSRNIMIINNNEQVLIDFQDARQGLRQYDLASLLDDCYYEISESNKKILLKYYYESSSIINTQCLNHFLAVYDDMVLQRVLKAIGSFCYIYYLRDDERYLKYIGFAMEKIKKIMISNEKYTDLRIALFGIYYES
jgi:aminoglycoside/choline kinase family phosphotransferase